MHFIKQRWQHSQTLAGDCLFLSILALLVFSAGLGLKDPWPADEPRFALIGKEMVDSGQWFFPMRGGELYPDKPPVFMWLIAAFYALTGSIKVAYLLPSLVSGWISVLAVYDLGRRLWHRRVGLASAVVLLLMVQFTLQAKTAQIDATLVLWVTLGMYGLLRHLLIGPAWGWFALSGVAMGLGVITKMIGFFPLMIMLPYAWCYFRVDHWQAVYRPRFLEWRWILSPLVTVATACAWILPMVYLATTSGDPLLIAYRDNLLLHQTADRYLTAWHHIKPFYFYVVEVIPWAWFPVSLALPWLIPAWWRRLRRGDSRYLLLLGWVALIVLFFSISAGKRGVYILSAAPVLALAVGPLVPGLLKKLRFQQVNWMLMVVLSLGLVAVAAWGFSHPELTEKLRLAPENAPWMMVMSLGIIGLALAAILRPRRGVMTMASFMLCFWLIIGWWGYPLLNSARSAEPFMADVGRMIGPESELAMVGWKEQFLLHADRHATNFGFRSPIEEQVVDAAAWLSHSDQRWVLIAKRHLLPCFDQGRAHYVGPRHRQEWYLVKADSVLAACQ